MDKIYDKTFTVAPEKLESYADFVAIVRQLRRDCPWDREQTPESVRHLMIEEVYEAVEAIDEGDWDELKRELGDLMLHVVFQAVMAEEQGRFNLEDVLHAEMEKLVRRHPHVFGEVQVGGVGEVLANWEQIKLQEKGKEQGQRSTLQGVPGNLPALLRAHRVQEKAASVGFDFPEREAAWEKVEEEMGEFLQLVESDAPAHDKEEEFGDLLFALVNYARFVDVNPENALRRTNDKFARRFRYIEERLAESGKRMTDVDLEEMDRYWDEAKRTESGE